jgi:signal transduction histidine kinase
MTTMWSTATWSLRARVTALVAATALLLGIIAATATVVALHNQSELDRLLNRQTPLVLNARDLLTALVNQETGIRGYALSGRVADLTPYDQGFGDESISEGNLLRLLGDRPDLADQVRQIQSAMTAWRAEIATPVIAAVQAGDRQRAQAGTGDAARNRFDDIRGRVGRLQEAITASRDATAAAVRNASNRLVELLIAAGLVILLAGIMLAVLLRYLVIGPVARLAAEVRRVVGGDYDHVVSIDGPPEVERLAGDVESMRRKIVRDLQEVRRARVQIEETNQQLESQAEELTRSNRDLEQFAYVASHDLQEPLRKVISFCQLLQRRYAGQLDERADQYISFAVDGAQRMQRLINDLLAFSRIGRITSGFADVDLDQVVREAVNQREAALEATGGSVTWENLPVVRGEEPLLASLFGNLISNSIKFHRAEEPPRIHLAARQVNDEWEISCADNGIGIDTEFADKVFVIFQRLHAKEVYPGTGIGLAIAKKIIEYHGGRIWLDTSVAEGTTIRFTLPAEPTPVSPAPAQPVEPVEETVS